MFAEGQRVWHRRGQHTGTVLECDGQQVYIVQDNGVELDFPASELTATPPEGASAIAKPAERGAAPKRLDQIVPTRTLTARDITPEHEKVLAVVPIRTLKEIAALYERRPKAGRFSALDVAGKLNVIFEITTVPYRTMREYRDRPSELGLLMGKGLADAKAIG